VSITDPAALTVFLLVLCRAAGWALTVPLFSMKGIPQIARIAVAFVLALVLAPTVDPSALPGGPSMTAVFFACAVTEVLLGAALGWMCSLMFRAAEMAGHIVDAVSAMNMANQFDPVSGGQGATFSRLYSLVFAALVFATNGHHQIIAAFGRLLDAAPPGTPFAIRGHLVASLASTLVAALAAAITLAAPLLGALFLTDAALGLMARFYPQANMLAMSLTTKPLVAIATLGLALTVLPAHVESLLEQGIRLAGRTLT
jgi:flagellar biosynthetic protein FliR